MHREELLRRLDRAGLLDYQRGLAALQDRAQAGKPAEEILISSGLVTEAALARLVAEAYRVPFMNLADHYVAPEVARLVPRDVAENYALLAVERDGDLLTVAMADPLDLMAEDLVRFMTSCQIRRVMAPRSELLLALAAAYDGTPWPRPEEPAPESLEVEVHPEGSQETVAPGRATALVLEGIREGATDMHFEPREAALAVRFRIDGRLEKTVELGPEARASVLAELRRLADFAPGDLSRPRMGRCSMRTPDAEVELAVSFVPCLHGQKVVLRVVERGRQVPDLERVGLLPEAFRRVVSLLEKPAGMLVVAGPAGSGKTGMVYGMLHHLGPEGRSLVALEDSWMPDLSGVTCIPIGSEPGTLSVRMALEGALLQDPDVILLRGLPDRETTDLALRAAGEALVITTLQAEGALAAVQRLQRLATSPMHAVSALLGVVGQRRARRLCEQCREEVASDRPGRLPLPERLRVPTRQFVSRGCKECRFTGYRDRLGLHEVLVMSDRVRDLFWAGAPERRILAAALEEGMVPLVEDGLAKVAMGLASLDEVLRTLPPEAPAGRTCGTCHRQLDEEFQVCPHCAPGLDRQCPSCQRPAQSDWKTCPYCRWSLGPVEAVEATREDLPAVAVRPSEEVAPPLPGLRTVLVADHDASVRAGMLQTLERSGYEVLLADDGQDAIEIIQQDTPDLVLAEVRLPRVDGLELCRRTRELGLALPILLLHPEPDAELREQVRDAGGDGVLGKAGAPAGWMRALVEALEDLPARRALHPEAADQG